MIDERNADERAASRACAERMDEKPRRRRPKAGRRRPSPRCRGRACRSLRRRRWRRSRPTRSCGVSTWDAGLVPVESHSSCELSVAASAEPAEVFEDFGVEDRRADLVDAHGPLAEIDLAAAVAAERKVLVFGRTSMPQVGQRRSFADFFLARAMRLLHCPQSKKVQSIADRESDTGHHVVLVGLGDLGAVEAAGFERFQIAEVVDVDLAVDFRRVELGAAFPQQRSLFAFAFGQQRLARGRSIAAWRAC